MSDTRNNPGVQGQPERQQPDSQGNAITPLCGVAIDGQRRQRLAAEIRAFIVENFMFGRDTPLSDDVSFMESGIVDSTGLLELVGFVEQRYGIAIADRELVPDNLDSLHNVTGFVARKLAERGNDGGPLSPIAR